MVQFSRSSTGEERFLLPFLDREMLAPPPESL